ncbi:MAG: poly(R)-hydroxyalkanoic acid synthase subunit PhaE [Pseudomonadota bacterium]
MADQASDFIRQSQAMAEQSWSQWMRYLQQAAGQPASPLAGFGMPGMAGMAGIPGMAAPGTPVGDVLERSLAGLASYLEWMQRAASAQATVPGTDWQASMKELFGAAGQPFTQAFGGIDSTAAQGFVQQWQAWLEAAGQAGMTDWRAPPHLPGFGLHREHHAKQQSLMAAMMESAEQQRRYQALILKASTQGLERLQDKLADHVEPGRQLDSLKALYDLWVDAAEEAYAEIALSDEFREVYGAMVNAQMRERQLVQEHLEDLCRQLGLPTRSEVDSLGRRLQEVRRELRAAAGGQVAAELAALREELRVLKASRPTAEGVPAKPASADRPKAKTTRTKTSARKATSAKARPSTVKSTVAKSAPAVEPSARAEGTVASKPKPKKVEAEASGKGGRPRPSERPRRAAATKSVPGARRSMVSPGIPAPHRARRK